MLLQQCDVVKAYSPQQITGFKFFDAYLNTLRRFVAIPTPTRFQRDRFELVEEVETGPFTVYRKHQQTATFFLFGRINSRNDDAELDDDDMDSFDYFVFDGELTIPLTDFNRTLWPRMNRNNSGKILREYVREKVLNLHDLTTRLVLINKFNYLAITEVFSTDSLLIDD